MDYTINRQEVKRRVPTMEEIQLKPLRLKFDINILDAVLSFIYKDSVLRTRKALSNISKLFNALDLSYYKEKPEVSARVWVIRQLLDAKLSMYFESWDIIKQFCKDHPEANAYTDVVVDNIGNVKLTYEEERFLLKSIEDRLEYGYTVTLKEIFMDLLNQIEDGDFRTYKEASDVLYDIATSFVNMKRTTSSLDSEPMFSLRQEMFENTVSEAVAKLQDKNRVYLTGIRRLNTLLSPGYQSKRLYTYLAFPGGGKSQVLLKAALDIKKYNPTIEPKKAGKTPAVLLLTMENDLDETIERMFNMAVMQDDIRNFTAKQIIRKLKDDGEMTLSDKNNVDIIIKYYPNRSINTNDLYNIIRDLEDDGTEVIALILDYLKRIKPAEKAQNEKEELKNVTNELKTLAKKLDIPVITAQQLNRASASAADLAVQNKKEDVARMIGRDGVSGAWEIIENSDVVIAIYQEMKHDTNDMYLGFKLLKRRYRSSETDEKLKRLEYFAHPYAPGSTIKLMDDIDAPRSLSVYSLATNTYPEAFLEPMGKHKTMIDRELAKSPSVSSTMNEDGVLETKLVEPEVEAPLRPGVRIAVPIHNVSINSYEPFDPTKSNQF